MIKMIRFNLMTLDDQKPIQSEPDNSKHETIRNETIQNSICLKLTRQFCQIKLTHLIWTHQFYLIKLTHLICTRPIEKNRKPSVRKSLGDILI
jgi:hypothetical protein